MYNFNRQYKTATFPSSVLHPSLRQDKVLRGGGTQWGGGGDIASLDVFYLWKIVSLILIFPNDMPDMYTELCLICPQLRASYPPNINCTDTFGNTALHSAVYCRQRAAAALLLENGINTSTKNNKGKIVIYGSEFCIAMISLLQIPVLSEFFFLKLKRLVLIFVGSRGDCPCIFQL